MAFSVTSDIYKTIFETLVSESDGGELDYVTTFQSRFYPVRREMEYNALYPYVFLSFSGTSNEELHSMFRGDISHLNVCSGSAKDRTSAKFLYRNLAEVRHFPRP